MEASSALVPSLQALHKDALKNRKKRKRGANGFFQIHRCQGDDQLRAAVCLSGADPSRAGEGNDSQVQRSGLDPAHTILISERV